ncbi:MAG: RNA polymerase sigma factor [Bacteroidales bacterium]|nr:RNA polymerase sigma factor [Bacteroidales bacterium]
MKINWQDTESVKRLVEGCIKGDKMSQQLLYKTFYGKMLVVCMRYTQNKEEALDILQDGFVKVFQKLRNFEHKGSLEGWIRRIMVNTAIDSIRRKKDVFAKTNEELELDQFVDDTFDDEELEKMTLLKAEILIELIQQLTPAYRTVFNMYVIENMTHAEIAQRLNINIGTSKSNLAKAKMKLKELFTQYIKTYYHETF